MKRLLSLAVLCLAPLSASANSSTASFSNEGLKLLKSEKIRMAREELFVSAERIRVRYTFENLTPQPIKTLVAFPFPDTDLMVDTDVSEVGAFTLTIGGKRQETRRETTYTVQGKKRDKAQAEALVHAEQARRESDEDSPTPGFTAREQHVELWEQEFPPGKGLEVEISYTPSVGGDLGWDRDTYKNKRLREKFCIDATTVKALDKTLARNAAADPEGQASGGRLQWLSYVLVTANNWAGPIGEFHLTLEKSSPTDVLSTCIDGLKKTSPVRFELTRKDFRPDRDLQMILFR
ncbi:DUF4424 family protein [Archangium primigenium]|uniref:DUF4424 family protein n=1 Tax=[Archangium] primigenium TaxID=2792470 RepID=UPI001EF868F0|nr:DUF4424 family protein [Archangium primigenium]